LEEGEEEVSLIRPQKYPICPERRRLKGGN